MNATTTIRVLPFSGKEKDWRMWSRKFLAASVAKGYREAVDPIDPLTDAKDDENRKAYSDLMLSMIDETTFGIIDEAKTGLHPDGDARFAWNELKRKFEPKTGFNEVKTKREFNSCFMEIGQDPDEWIHNLIMLQRRLETMGTKISERDVMIHILGNLTEDYENITDYSEKELLNGSLTLEALRDTLRTKFEKLNKKTGSDEAALFTKQFKGMCKICGKIGHKDNDCFKLEKNKIKKENYMKNLRPKREKPNYPNIQCYNCQRMGHYASNCRNKRVPREKNHEEDDAEIALMAITKTKGIENPNLWIADTGASCHMCNNLDGLTNIIETSKTITVGNGERIQSTKIGTWKGILKDSNGKERVMKLENVSYVPSLTANLMSLTQVMRNSWILSGNDKSMSIEKGKVKIVFDKRIRSGNGFLLGIEFEHRSNDKALLTKEKIDLQQAHEMFGHADVQQVKATLNQMGIEPSDKSIECLACGLTKAKQKAVPKEDVKRSTTPGQRLSIDISSVKTPSSVRKQFWLLVIDQATSMKWSFFIPKKSDQVDHLISLVKEINQEKGKRVEFIRCDNAGENKSFEAECKKEGLNITFEYTARNTPQQNGQVERAFATLYGRMRAMMKQAGFSDNEKQKFWTECASTATKTDNVLIRKGQQESPYKQFYKEDPAYQKHLKPFGTKAVMTTKRGSDIKGKLDDRGTLCTFLGYARNHTGDTYRMRNNSTGKTVITRDLKWLAPEKKMLEILPARSNNSIEVETIIDEEDRHDEEIVEFEPEGARRVLFQDYEEIMDPEGQEDADSPKTPREVRNLRSYNNPGRIELGKEREVYFCFLTKDGEIEFDAPLTFQEAWNHHDEDERKLWRASIRLEFRQMLKNGVWRKDGGTNDLPSGRKGLGMKWVFKKKKNGVYRSRLVAKGYDQVAGVDFQHNFAPVVNDTTVKILFGLWLQKKYRTLLVDVKTAFLYGRLEELLFAEIPEGYERFMKEEYDEKIDYSYVKLEKTIYGLVQAARAWWKEFMKVMKNDLHFRQFENDNCLLRKEDKNGFIAIGVYVDDNFVIGDDLAIETFLSDIKKHFDITTTEVDDFVGCTVEKHQDYLELHQPDLIRKMLKEFNDEIKEMKVYETPAPSGFRVIRTEEEETKLSKDKQTRYRSGVGSLLYLVKHSRPDLSNSVRELSKVMDNANEGQYKMLLRSIKYVNDTQDFRLKLKANGDEKSKWKIKAYCDSDFAGDSDGRKSISGFVIYMNGMPISWRSKGQKSVSLSSTEAEYMAISEVAMELLFVHGVMKFLGMDQELPMIVNVDNVGAIYLSQSATTSNRTKHIDVRYHFVREFIEDGIVKIVFVRSAENDADLFTKNLGGELYRKHRGKVMTLNETKEEGIK